MSSTPEEQKFVDARVVGEKYGLTRRSVLHYAKTGKIPAIRIGRHWRFNLQAIAEHFRTRNVTTPSTNVMAAAARYPTVGPAETGKTGATTKYLRDVLKKAMLENPLQSYRQRR